MAISECSTSESSLISARNYRPYPLLRSGHLQTLMVGVSCGVRPVHCARPIEVDLEDGERLVVHEELLPNGVANELRVELSDETPLVILLHGLGGDHTSPYLQRIAYAVRQAGCRVWRVDMRGSGHGLKLAWRPAHAGCSHDLASVVNTAHQIYPQAPLRIAGFSLSGNIVLKMLAEAALGILQPAIDLAAIERAIDIAPPVDLHDCANNMDRPSRSIYTHYYLKMLDKQVEVRRQQWPQWEKVAREPRVRTIRQFDARYTAPLAGFTDTDHYYSTSSSLGLLSHITTPTTILIDRHDPIVTATSFDKARLNSASTKLITTARGGHMGYFGLDSRGRLFRWLEHFVTEHVRH